MTGSRPEREYLPTPSVGVNRALGGKGLESGRIHVYWGPKASGKTTFALQQIAVAQRQGKICAFIDSEKAFSKKWAQDNGVDTDKLLYHNSMVVEETLELLMPEIKEGKIDLLVVDSVNSLTYASYFDSPDSNAMGTYARSAKFFTHKLLHVLNENQQVIFISQAAMAKQGQNFNLKASVGSAIEHWASTMIKFTKTMYSQPDPGKENDGWRKDGSFRVDWRIDKSKQSVYPVKGSYWFNPGTAEIDNVEEITSAVKAAGVVTSAGAWIYYPDKDTCGDNRWNGANALTEELRSNLTLRDEFIAKLNETKIELAAEDDEDGID